MMDEQREASTRTGPGVAQHWKITVRITEREQRSATDMETNVPRLRLAIVEAVEFRELCERKPIVFDIATQFCA
jgi:hypothetical protein